MLDRVDPGPDSRLDPRRAMGVGGDLQPPLMRLVGDRAKLLLGQLLLTRLGVARVDAAGGADLDHLRAIFPLLAPPLPQLLRPIPDRLAHPLDGGRPIGAVALPARRRAPWRGVTNTRHLLHPFPASA